MLRAVRDPWGIATISFVFCARQGLCVAVTRSVTQMTRSEKDVSVVMDVSGRHLSSRHLNTCRASRLDEFSSLHGTCSRMSGPRSLECIMPCFVARSPRAQSLTPRPCIRTSQSTVDGKIDPTVANLVRQPEAAGRYVS